VLFICIIRLASNEIFSPSKKIHREVGWAKDLPAPRYFYITAHDIHKRQTSVLSTKFQTAMPGSERPQTARSLGSANYSYRLIQDGWWGSGMEKEMGE
jgi:hypothetical protein